MKKIKIKPDDLTVKEWAVLKTMAEEGGWKGKYYVTLSSFSDKVPYKDKSLAGILGSLHKKKYIYVMTECFGGPEPDYEIGCKTYTLYGLDHDAGCNHC